MPELTPLTNDEPDVRFLAGDRVRIISTDRDHSVLSGFEVGQEVTITSRGHRYQYEVVHPESGVGYCDAICLQHVPIRDEQEEQEIEMPPYGVDIHGFVYRSRPEHMKSSDSLTMREGDKAILISERAGWVPLYGFNKGCLVQIQEVRPLHCCFPDYRILKVHPESGLSFNVRGYAYEEELVSASINYELKGGYYPSPEEIWRVIGGGF